MDMTNPEVLSAQDMTTCHRAGRWSVCASATRSVARGSGRPGQPQNKEGNGTITWVARAGALCLSDLVGSSEGGRGFGSARASLSSDRQLALQPGEGVLQVLFPFPSPPLPSLPSLLKLPVAFLALPSPALPSPRFPPLSFKLHSFSSPRFPPSPQNPSLSTPPLSFPSFPFHPLPSLFSPFVFLFLPYLSLFLTCLLPSFHPNCFTLKSSG